MKKYIVKLTDEERVEFERVACGKNGKQNIAAWKVVRAKVLLKCDQGPLGPVLERKPRLTPPMPPKLDGEGEAQLTKLACSVPPQGRSHWTLRLLAEHLVELEVVESISHETVRQVLKKVS